MMKNVNSEKICIDESTEYTCRSKEVLYMEGKFKCHHSVEQL